MLTVLHAEATAINMECNIKRIDAVDFLPEKPSWSYCYCIFFAQSWWLVGYINYVRQFKYLGHIVSCDMTDDNDIEREIKNMFIRSNMLI